jgi:hypothetical protein
VFGIILVVLNVLMVLAAVVQMALVGRRAYTSRQNSVLGLRKLKHANNNDDNDSVVNTLSAAAAPRTDEYETTEHGVTYDNNALH